VELDGFETKLLIPLRQSVVIEKGLLGSAAPKGPGSRNLASAAESSKPRGELNRNVRPAL
jgi:hypothetical protein